MNSTQLKVTLPLSLLDYAQASAQRFGLSMSAYLKHLIIADVKNDSIPEFTMSDSTEKIALKALNDFSSGKLKKIDSVDQTKPRTKSQK